MRSTGVLVDVAFAVAVDGHFACALLDYAPAVRFEVFDVDCVGADHGDEVLESLHGVGCFFGNVLEGGGFDGQQAARGVSFGPWVGLVQDEVRDQNAGYGGSRYSLSTIPCSG